MVRARGLRRLALGLVALGAVHGPAFAASDARGFGDWFVACQDARCAATHETDLVELEVVFETGQDPRILFHVARQARVGDPITIRLEDGERAHLKVNRCFDSHCTGEADYDKLSPEMIAEVRHSKRAVIAYLVKGIIVIAPISFEGYMEASSFARERTGQ